MKKFSVFLILCITVWLVVANHRAETNQLGTQLVADAYYGNLLDVKEDVEEGAPISYTVFIEDEDRNYNGVWFNALHAAASGGNEDVILYLLNQGININTPTPDGWTPLFIAVRDGQTEAAKLLVYKEANVNAQTNLGATALLMAVTQPFPTEQERVALISYLLNNDANPTLQDVYGHTPLYYAEKLGNQEVMDLLKNTPLPAAN